MGGRWSSIGSEGTTFERDLGTGTFWLGGGGVNGESPASGTDYQTRNGLTSGVVGVRVPTLRRIAFNGLFAE